MPALPGALKGETGDEGEITLEEIDDSFSQVLDDLTLAGEEDSRTKGNDENDEDDGRDDAAIDDLDDDLELDFDDDDIE